MSLREVPLPLTRRGIPLERDLRVLALGSFANRFGAGAVMTTSALYFTRQVGFSATGPTSSSWRSPGSSRCTSS